MKRALSCLLALLACLLASCSGLGAPGATPTPALSEQEIAQRAVDKLSALNSFHFDLSTDTGGKPAGTGFALVSAKGDVVRPDKLSADIQASVSGFTASLKYVSAGGKHYMTDPISQQWMEVPAQFNTIAVFSPDTGAPQVVKSLQGLKKQGTEAVAGADSYHLAGTAPGDVLQPLLGASAPGPLKADVWTGTSDFLTRKIVLTGAIFQGEPDTTVRTLLLSNFDENVSISAPAVGTRPS
ncbi:MAG TPA: LppX_LprAFG lipoprotein [Chloroflexota bacterium]|nr:LppX_LprAFG lipoprotein [Chloroflexota bacterium]